MTTFDYPFRLRFLRGLTAVLQTITPANGYKTDLSAAVFRGRLTFGTSDPLPMVSIIEPPIMPDRPQSPDYTVSQDYSWDMIIQGFAVDDKKNPTDPAHVLLADVKCAIAKEVMKIRTTQETAFGIERRKILGVTMDLGFVRPSDDISAHCYFWLPMRVKLSEDWLNPYN